MTVTYQEILEKNIDLSPFGIFHRDQNLPYFCTPEGASIFAWTGVDGIHYCFVPGFGDMVFAVNPMDTPGDYVHPVAKSFSDFLRLLLACGDEAALEQAYGWTQEIFDAFLQDNPITQEKQRSLDAIIQQTGLTPMEAPFSYIKNLQAEFDDSKIKYTEDFDDSCADLNPESEWKVCFDDNLWQPENQKHGGTEIAVNQEFFWGNHRWLIPAVYSCEEGLILDFCMQIEPEQIRSFQKKWGLDLDSGAHEHFSKEQQMEIERDDPSRFDFYPHLILNGQALDCSRASTIYHNPCQPEDAGRVESKYVISHYSLDASYSWSIRRFAFPWEAERPSAITTLSITMEQQPVFFPGPCFQVTAPGDRFCFVHPTTGQSHTLTVQEYEQQECPQEESESTSEWDFPTHCTVMAYTITPELPDNSFSIQDCAEGDQARRKKRDPMDYNTTTLCHCVGVVRLPKEQCEHLKAACSSLHFAPTDDVTWRMIFHEKQFEDLVVTLI